MSIAVVILTYNEDKHIERAIRSVAGLADQIIVVDSFSTDRTVDIARGLGAEVVQNRFKNQADQFQWGLDNTVISAEWILRLDADEVIEADLSQRIQSELPKLPLDVTGVNIDRKHIFLGRFIRHGGRYPLTLLRIFRKGFGRVEQRWMDEHIIVESGRTVHMKGGFADHNLNDLSYFTDKHNKYASREAVEVINQRQKLFGREVDMTIASASRQAAIKRLIKEKIYNRIPYPISSLGYFLFRYFVQLGFLDGREGLTYHFLQGYWYRFLVGAKVLEFERELADIEGQSAKLARLAAISGLPLERED